MLSRLEGVVRRLLKVTDAQPSPSTVLSVASECARASLADVIGTARDSAADGLVSSLTHSLAADAGGESGITDAVSVAVRAAVASVLVDESAAGKCVSDAWNTFALHILTAQPPYPAPLISQVCHAVGTIASVALSTALLRRSLECLACSGDNVDLPLHHAVELLENYVVAITTSEQASSSNRRVCLSPEEIADASLVFFSKQQHDPTVIPMVTRKLFIPLLLFFRESMMDKYVRSVMGLIRRMYEQRLLAEVIVMIAALFDVLFRRDSLNLSPANDFRYNELLWCALHDAMVAAMESTDETAGRRTTMQLQVTYLLKRIVDVTVEQSFCAAPPSQQQQSKKGSVAVNAAYHDPSALCIRHRVVFHQAHFPWQPSESKAAWHHWFLVMETLNEYGVHINAPALAKLDSVLPAVVSGDASGFAASWLQLALTKALIHPNMGVRKLALRKIWTLPVQVVSLLSQSFLCEVVFKAAADVRLCSEIDRVLLPGSFLDCKVFDGREDHTLPKVLPLVEQLQKFYATVVNSVCTTGDAQAAAITTLIQNASAKSTRFTIAVLIRVIWHVFVTLQAQHSDSAASEGGVSCLTGSLLSCVQQLLKELVYDRHPLWLEMRLNAMVLDAVTHLAFHASELLRQPVTRLNPNIASSLKRTLAMCSSCGETGGRAVASIDASGTIDVVGSALSAQLAAKRLSDLRAAAEAASDDLRVALLDDIMSTRKDVDELLRSQSQSEEFAPLRAKESAAYISALPRDDMKALWAAVVSNMTSLGRRTYMSPVQLCVACSVFVECWRSGPQQVLSSSTDEGLMVEIFDFLSAYIARGIVHGVALVRAVDAVDHFSLNEGWSCLRTTEWDAVCAALCVCVEVLIEKLEREGVNVLSTISVSGVIGSLVTALVDMFTRLQLPQTLVGVAHLGLLVLCRNVARALHSVVTPFTVSPAALEVFLSLTSPRENIECSRLLRQHCFAVHLGATDTPTSLTSLSWGSVMTQYYRYLYHTLYVFGLSLTQTVRSETLFSSRVSVDEQPAVRLYIAELEDFASDHLDRCSTSNMSALYDILSWTLSMRTTAVMADVEFPSDKETVIRNMLSRLDSGQRKEFFRCSAIGIVSLRCSDDHEFVRKNILKLLCDENESDRAVLFAIAMLVNRVLGNVKELWPVYKDVLLHACILYSSGISDEEGEGCCAVTEPVIATILPDTRHSHPASVRLASLTRAMALSTVLFVASQDGDEALRLSTELVMWNTTNKVVSHEPCMPNSKAHRARVRLWQLLCALLPTLRIDGADNEGWSSLIDLVANNAMHINNMGSVRRFMELFLIGAFLRNSLLYPKLAAILDDYTLRTQIIGSYGLVAVHLLLKKQATVPGLFDSLFPRLMRLCASNQHLLRIISHIGVHRSIKQRAADVPGWAPPPEAQAIFDFIDKAPESLKFREKNEETVLFDATMSLSPRQIFCIQRKETNMWLKDSIPASSFDRMRHIELELSSVLGAISPFECLRSRILKELMTQADTGADGNEHRCVSIADLQQLSIIPHSEHAADCYMDYTRECMEAIGTDEVQEALEAAAANSSDNIQRKVTSWWNSEVYNELHPRALGNNTRQSLIVVGSLLENPVNIAGLCRCGEIFTVEKVIVPDKKVFEHAHFVATARSAEQWIPWEEVHPINLIQFLQRMRSEGYTIVGIEQTATSVSMASYAFPERVVMVLGSEGQGIPAEYLSFLDVCVEIPQYGLIRSLNVHVTGGIVMYEYTKQHLMARNALGAQRPQSE